MIYVQIKQIGTHQNTTFHNIRALLDMLQCSHNSHILILILVICDKEINNQFRFPVPLFNLLYK